MRAGLQGHGLTLPAPTALHNLRQLSRAPTPTQRPSLALRRRCWVAPRCLQQGRRDVRVDSRDTRAMASFGMDRESVDLDEIAAIQLPEYDVRREKDRRFRRTVFNHDRWSAHRSTDRYARHLLGLFRSRTFVSLMRPLTLLTSFAFTVGAYEYSVANHAISEIFPSFKLDSEPFEITSFALSLLLVFRTDASYARYKNALDAWSEVKSTCKELARLGSCWIHQRKARAAFMRWIAAFPKALSAHLRTDGDLRKDLQGVLTPQEVEAIARSSENGPNYVLQVLSTLVEDQAMNPLREEKLEERLSALNSCESACEQLLRYPIPLGYTRHTSRFLMLWLGFLPFALWADCGWAVVPVEAVVAFLLLGIEEIGVQIEESFGIVPLEDICEDVLDFVDQLPEYQAGIETLLEAIYEDGSEEPPGPYSSSANGHNGASREAGSAIASFDEADALRRIGAAPGGYVLGESMAQRRKPREAAFETLHD